MYKIGIVILVGDKSEHPSADQTRKVVDEVGTDLFRKTFETLKDAEDALLRIAEDLFQEEAILENGRLIVLGSDGPLRMKRAGEGCIDLGAI